MASLTGSHGFDRAGNVRLHPAGEQERGRYQETGDPERRGASEVIHQESGGDRERHARQSSERLLHTEEESPLTARHHSRQQAGYTRKEKRSSQWHQRESQ